VLLDGRRAIVTGASSGIGKEASLRLAKEGSKICINYYSDKEKDAADQVVQEIQKEGGTAISVQADVGDEDDVRRLVGRTVQSFGGLDLLVNNAGIEKKFSLIEMPLAEWDAVLRTNLTGAFLCLREAAKVMGQGSVIVNVSSVHEYIPWPGFAHYCASKGGLKLLMQTAARELAPRGVRVLNVAPGAIVTPINDFVLRDPEAKQAIEDEIPMGRMGKPDEIAAAIAWAASAEAGYVTGSTLIVDGGMSLYPRFV
jgi:glucose 1-dehydrogenase